MIFQRVRAEYERVLSCCWTTNNWQFRSTVLRLRTDAREI